MRCDDVEACARFDDGRVLIVWTMAAISLGTTAYGQALPNPYRLVDDWAKLPADGRWAQWAA